MDSWGNSLFSNYKTVTANKGTGLTKANSYLILGGEINRYHENFYGYLKDIRFYDKLALSFDQFKCLSDYYCSKCDNAGVCSTCKYSYYSVKDTCTNPEDAKKIPAI